MQEKLHFKISSALKDIIGRDLITDDFVAVFELVKNSYDAYATQVDIYFEEITNQNPKIIIKDNGKGMNYDDLINKWLFVAYSAKKEGTEDDSFDYRNRISFKRAFAGAKGIGRFSCDRLGRILYLETTKHEESPKTEVLITEWEKFESDLRDEFIDISVLHETKHQSDYQLKHGTVLEISDLRSEWDRSKLLKLKESLSKLINPNNYAKKEFSIFIHVPELIDSDNNFTESYEKVNGEVENFIFDTLNLKTTRINTTISEDGQYLETELLDGGSLIYKIKEKNKYTLLSNIEYTLYYLNRSAKVTFSKRMGLSVAQYGNIFLYKNGFRIYPFGEPGEDPLKINVRKTQGFSRFLGLRDLVGKIEINNNDNELRETSSRGDGFIKTKTYLQLEECFWETLKRLEKYVVDVQQWGFNIEEDEELIDKDKIIQLIESLTGAKEIIDFQYPTNFLDILFESQSESAEQVVKNLSRIAFELGDEKLINEAKKATQKLEDLRKAVIEAEKETAIERTKLKEFKIELEEKDSENLFLKSIKSQDLDEILSFIHHIGIYAGIIENYLRGFSLRLNFKKEISVDELTEIVNNISLEVKKIINISSFATKANFKLSTEFLEINVGEYIKEYVQNIIPRTIDKSIRVNFFNDLANSFIKNLKPIELNILIDNMISNAKKFGASEVIIVLGKNENYFLKFINNGAPIEEAIKHKIFNFGFTTTTGSGLGLFHVKKIVQDFNGKIEVNNINNGVEFIITF